MSTGAEKVTGRRLSQVTAAARTLGQRRKAEGKCHGGDQIRASKTRVDFG